MIDSGLRPADERAAALIRIAFLSGVLIFGAVTWFLHRQPGYVSPGDIPPFRIALSGVMMLALGGIVAVRFILSRATEAMKIIQLRLVGWSMGEMAALAGGVYYLLTDNPQLFVMGLFVLLASFIVVPLRRP